MSSILPKNERKQFDLMHHSTVNSWFKKDKKLQIHQHKAFFSDDQFLDSLHESFLNQTTLNLRKEKMDLNREVTVLVLIAIIHILLYSCK